MCVCVCERERERERERGGGGGLSGLETQTVSAADQGRL